MAETSYVFLSEKKKEKKKSAPAAADFRNDAFQNANS